MKFILQGTQNSTVYLTRLTKVTYCYNSILIQLQVYSNEIWHSILTASPNRSMSN